MKNILLAVAILFFLFSVPCFAQMETENFFSPDKTLWRINRYGWDGYKIGFYNNAVWYCLKNSYGELSCSEVGPYQEQFLLTPFSAANSQVTLKGYVIPIIGFGMVTVSTYGNLAPLKSSMIKISNSFSVTAEPE